MTHAKVYLVGARYQHYASHSGYESIDRYCGKHLKAPVKFRWLAGNLGWQVDKTLTALTPRPLYPLGIFLTEAATALHMQFQRKSLYHVLYGDTDVWLLGYAKQITGNRLVATFHEPTPVLEWYKIDQIVPNLDAVILVSASQRAYFEQFLPPERIYVVPHGIDTNFFKPAQNLSHEPICITVGSHWRDFETLKSAITLIREVNPQVRFIAVGAGRPGGNNPRLEDDRVEFLDGLSDEELLQVYQQSRIAVFPFREATANNALLEAMACGLPVVATDIGGVREYLGDEAGFLCQPQDPEDFAKAVLQLVDDYSLAAKMSQASRARALEFDFPVVAKQMNQVYSEILPIGS